MRPLPLLLAGALLFWGACTGHLLLAIGMATVLEGVLRLHQRWELGRRDFEVLADLCTLALAGVLSYLFAQTRNFPGSLAAVLVWLPAFYFVLMLAQRAGSTGRVPISAVLWSLRDRKAAPPEPHETVPLDFAYAGLCVIAAAAANVRSPWFFAGACALCLYALWPARRGGEAPRRWLALAACAATIGFGIQLGLTALQAQVEEAVLDWLTTRLDEQGDPYRAHTAIGDLGRVKLSDRIVLRVRMPAATSASARVPLLRTASYQRYAGGGWIARNQAFSVLESRGRTWEIGRGAGSAIEISSWFASGRALLALPSGTYRLDDLQAMRAERNPLGAVRVAEGPDPLLYRAWFDRSTQTEAQPGADDLDVPAKLVPVLGRVVAEIGDDRDARRFVDRLSRFFATRFTYSLSLTSASGEARDLTRFLEADRRGHCEYFATATALLLRRAGIPARYAVGYSVQEYSALEGQYVGRRRDAHAWAIAWVGGRWVDVDTTPGTWYAEESRDSSMLQPVYDLFSWLNYRLAAWRTQDGGEGNNVLLWLSGGVLVALVAWRLYCKRARVASPDGARASGPRADSRALQPVLEQLARRGHVRPAGVPLLRWVRELPLADAETRRLLVAMARLQYELRFGAPASRADVAVQLQRSVERLEARLRAGDEGAQAG